MAYRAVLMFLILTITRQVCGFLLPFHGGRPSRSEILGGEKKGCQEAQEGSEVILPLTLAVPCIKCICEGGVVKCNMQKCPLVQPCRGIVVKKPGACCQECQAQEGDHCSYQGKTYENGETWLGGKCKKCKCDKGLYTCEDQVCEKNLQCPTGTKKGYRPGACCESCVEETAMCTSFGDPHYQTFDNRMYNYQGKCKYIFAKDCATNNFSVQVRNEGRHSRTFSWTKSVFLHYNGMEVALLQNLRVKVNGEAISLPYHKEPDLYIKEDGFLMTVTTGIGLQVVWDGDSYTEVHVPISYKNKTCGFCGNFNGNPNDDFQTPEGEVKTNTKEFAVSWQVRNNKMSSCDDEASSATHYLPRCKGENLMHARKQCFVLKDTKFDRCHDVVNPRPHYKSCVNDMCHCPRSQVHSCLCQSLTAYARACQQRGILVKWRSKSVCGIKCKGGAIYDDCGPACRLTCSNKDDVNKLCTKPCVAGCQCPAGKVWHKKKCITPSKCPKSKKRKTFAH